jgi:uncharacterized damage-inducible protein DinB
MNQPEILKLFRYNAWANSKILSAVVKVPLEQFVAPRPYPHGGLRGTLVHALFAEYIWRTRWEGTSLTERFKEEEFPTFQSLYDRWQQEETKLLAFVETVTDKTLNGPLEYKTTKGVPQRDEFLWMVMFHVINHGTQHRAEAAAMLTELGHSPGDIDLIVYMREQS